MKSTSPKVRLDVLERRAKLESSQLDNRERSIRIQLAESQLQAAQDIRVNEAALMAFVDRDSAPWFDPLSYATDDAIDQNTQIEMQRKAFQAWSLDAFYHGLVEIIVRFVGSTRTKLIALDEDPKTQEALDDYCRDQRMADGHVEKGFTIRFEEQVRRYVRDGEYFKRSFVRPMDGWIARRFLNVLWVRSRGQPYDNFGVVSNPQDIEHIFGYIYWTGPAVSYFQNRSIPIFIPAAEIIHGKNGDSSWKRGRPYLLPVTQKLLNLRELLRSRLKFHWLSCLYGVQRKVSGSNDIIQALINRQKAGVNNPTGTKMEGPAEGNMVTMSKGVELEIKTAMLHAIDADQDVRRIIYEIVACLGISYTVGSGDPSQANYNAGSQQENPMLKTMDGIQGKLAPDCELEGEEVLKAKIDAGMLPRTSFKTNREVSPGTPGVSPTIVKKSTETVERMTRVKVDFPAIMETDVIKAANARAIDIGLGLCSRMTAQVAAGYDPEEESRRLKIQKIEDAENQDAEQGGALNGELLASQKTGVTGGDGNGTKERNRVMSKQSDE